MYLLPPSLPGSISLSPVIQSLIAQTIRPDEIQIQLPEICKKEQKGYQIPAFIKNYDSVKIIHRKDDLGSATKWFYPLISLKDDPESILVVVDDDCTYEPESIELLIRRISQIQDTSYCYTGGILSRNPQKIKQFVVSKGPVRDSITIIENNKTDLPVDTIQGFSMFAVRPNWFDDFNFSILDSGVLPELSDDILISGLLAFQNIQRVQVGPYKIPSILHQSEINPIHGEGRLFKMSIDAIKYLQKELGVWENVTCHHPVKKNGLKGGSIAFDG